ALEPPRALEALAGQERLDLVDAPGQLDERPRHGAHQAWRAERPLRRATPALWAALTTSRATAGATLWLNTLGMMYSSCSSCRLTMEAMAWAAAIFISSVTRRARQSRRPRKKPGKHSTLLIWLGESGRPGAITRPWGAAA